MAEDTDFGIDLYCTDDCLLGFNRVNGLTLMAQAVYRRLTTPRGAIIDTPDYGFDVRTLINKGMTSDQIANIPDLIKSEILKDERINTVDVKITPTSSSLPNGSLILSLLCTTNNGPFSLTISVTQAAVTLLPQT